jgi:hypothetical protein
MTRAAIIFLLILTTTQAFGLRLTWENIHDWELRCLNDLLTYDGMSVARFKAYGAGPDDPFFTTYRLRCKILERYIKRHVPPPPPGWSPHDILRWPQ